MVNSKMWLTGGYFYLVVKFLLTRAFFSWWNQALIIIFNTIYNLEFFHRHQLYNVFAEFFDFFGLESLVLYFRVLLIYFLGKNLPSYRTLTGENTDVHLKLPEFAYTQWFNERCSVSSIVAIYCNRRFRETKTENGK